MRALSKVNSATLADRLGISHASISRYENKTRQPPIMLMKDIHTAYVQLLETALVNAETILIIDSYRDSLGTDGDTIIEPDNLITWIANGTDLEDFTLAHIEPSASVRAWLPYPTWRTPSAGNLWLTGYPNARALQPT